MHLQSRLKGISDRAAAKRKEADAIEREGEQIEQAITFLDQLLPPKAQPKAATELSQQSGGEIKNGLRFSLMHDACTKCGRGPAEGIKHAAKGLCQACYWNETHQKTDADLDAAVSLVANGTGGPV